MSSKNNDSLQNVVDFYLIAYREGWERSTKSTFHTKKDDARRYADEVCPAGVGLMKSHMDYVKATNGNKRESPEAKAGQAIVQGIRSVCAEYRRVMKDNNTVAANGNGAHDGHGNYPKTARGRFEAACKLGFVPVARVAAALLDVDPSYPNQLRYLLSDTYDFTSVDNGYEVAPKRSEKQLKMDSIKAELARLANELAKLQD